MARSHGSSGLDKILSHVDPIVPTSVHGLWEVRHHIFSVLVFDALYQQQSQVEALFTFLPCTREHHISMC